MERDSECEREGERHRESEREGETDNKTTFDISLKLLSFSVFQVFLFVKGRGGEVLGAI